MVLEGDQASSGTTPGGEWMGLIIAGGRKSKPPTWSPMTLQCPGSLVHLLGMTVLLSHSAFFDTTLVTSPPAGTLGSFDILTTLQSTHLAFEGRSGRGHSCFQHSLAGANYPPSKNFLSALAGVAQWIERRPENQRAAGSIPSQGTCLGCRPGPQ